MSLSPEHQFLLSELYDSAGPQLSLARSHLSEYYAKMDTAIAAQTLDMELREVFRDKFNLSSQEVDEILSQIPSGSSKLRRDALLDMSALAMVFVANDLTHFFRK